MKEFLISTFNRSFAFFKKDLINQTSYRLSFFLNIVSIFIAVYVFFIFSKLFEGSNSYLEEFGNNKNLKEAFGDDVINSYIKLKNQELDSFDKEESFDKRSSITEWEKINTLDC